MLKSLILIALITAPCLSQQAAEPPPAAPRPPSPVQAPPQRRIPAEERIQNDSAEANLTHFDLDFPGGTPKSLVDAISKAIRHPLNVIIQPEDDEVLLPPLKMFQITVPSLFKALEEATQRQVNVITGTSFDFNNNARAQYMPMSVSCTFRSDRPYSENAIWYFSNRRPPEPPDQQKSLKFYNLATALESHNLDDITSAITKGLEMIGHHKAAQMSYHKQTKLLIVAGSPEETRVVENVLDALGVQRPSSTPKQIAAPPAAEPSTPPKTPVKR